MRWNIVKAIYFKELRETLRDRRTITFMLVLPLLLYPMMIIGLTRFQRDLEQESSQRTARLAVWGEAPPELIAQLKSKNFDVQHAKGLNGELRAQLEKAAVEPFPSMPDADDPDAEKKAEKLRDEAGNHPLVVAARPAILDRNIDLVLVLWPQAPGKEDARNLAILFDSVRQDSRRARGRLLTVLDDYREKLLKDRESRRGLDPGFTKGVKMQSRDVANKNRRSGFGIGMMLPFLLLAISASAGFYRAVDTTAGEKERNTMQTLLCAPVRSIEIVGGKFAAISTITLIAAGANIASLGLTFGNVAKQVGAGGTSLSISQYLLTFLCLVPVTMLTSALFLAIGVFAKDFRDGQNMLTPVMMLTMMPAAITMLPGVEANALTLMMPCVNVALLIKALMVGEAKPDQIFITLVSSAAYAMLALTFAARVFERETVLTGGKDTFRGLFGFTDKRREVTPSMAFAAFCAVLVLLFYGSALTKVDLKYVLLLTEYGMILAPTLAIVLALRLPVRDTLSLHWPGWKPMIAAVLVGASGWSVAHMFVRFLAPPESLVKAIQKVMLLDRGDISVLWLYFLGAITPAICEELFFRGLVQGGLRKVGMAGSIIISAILFGVAHGSIYRMLPVTFLGLVIGWLFWNSRSVFPGMVAHALNNGVAISLIAVPALRDYVIKHDFKQVPLSWSAVGAVVMLAGLWLAASSREQPNPSTPA